MTSSLEPIVARAKLGALGRLLYDVRPDTLWERDTRLLPRRYRRARRRYRDFARDHVAPRALERDRDVDYEALRELFLVAARHGLQTELLPKPFGSGELRSLLGTMLWPAALKAEELCAACGGLGLGLLAHDLGIAPLFVSGSLRSVGRWQRRIYREIQRGEPALAAFAITEPNAGSDVEDTEGGAGARLMTRARRVTGGWRISGSKCFISNGRLARWVTLFAAQEAGGLDTWTCFLLDSAMEGYRVGRSERKLGQRASDATELLLDDVFVPDERVIGPVGAGWAINRNVLNFSRPVVGGIGVGIARGALEHALTFCKATRLGNRPLVSYQDVQLRLAHMLTRVQAARALVWHTMRQGRPSQAAGAMPKVFAAEVAWDVSTEAVELLGDHGYVPGNGVEKAARDARLNLIYEGTHQINLLAIIEGQKNAELAP